MVMKAAVIGAGSIGLLLAAKLAAAGTDVLLVCRTKEQAKVIAADGIVVRSEQAQNERVRVAGAVHGEEMQDAARDWALIAVKQTHWDDRLLGGLVRLAASGTRLAAFQNGIGHAERLLEAGVPKERLYLAVTTEAARREGPNIVARTGRGMTRIGPVLESGAVHDEAAALLVDAMKAAGFEAEDVPDIGRHVWRKLLINAAINPLAAITGARNGELAGCERYRRVMRQALMEAVFLARTSGAEPGEDMWAAVLDVCAKTAQNEASMLQDVRAGRETEIEAITGALIRMAEERGVDVPVNRALYRLVKAMTEPGMP